jgi:hypothetical protein
VSRGSNQTRPLASAPVAKPVSKRAALRPRTVGNAVLKEKADWQEF